MFEDTTRGQESPDRPTNRLRTDGGEDTGRPEISKELFGDDRLSLDSGSVRIDSPMVNFWPEGYDDRVSLGIGFGHDAVRVNLWFNTDDREVELAGDLTPTQARKAAAALETFADAVEEADSE